MLKLEEVRKIDEPKKCNSCSELARWDVNGLLFCDDAFLDYISQELRGRN